MDTRAHRLLNILCMPDVFHPYNRPVYLFNGAYLRLKTLALGYTLPREWTNKVKLSTVRLSLSGYNLFEISQIPDLYDPDQISSSYPMMRSVAFGLQVGF